MPRPKRARRGSWFDALKIIVIVVVLFLVAWESHMLLESLHNLAETTLQWLYPMDNAKLVALLVVAVASFVVALKVLGHVHGLLNLLLLVYRASDALVEGH